MNEPNSTTPISGMDYDFLQRMETCDPASVHARNKARTYYKVCFQKNTTSTLKFAVTIKNKCETAMASNDWKPVAILLADLW